MPNFIHAIYCIKRIETQQTVSIKSVPCDIWLNTDYIVAAYAEGLEHFVIIKDAVDNTFQVEGGTCDLDTALDKLHDSEYAKMMQNREE